MKVIGLFAGVGGIELGFEKAGFEVAWSNEIDKDASNTFKQNHKSPLLVKDITQVAIDDIPEADIIVAGFPCQAFSIAGYRKGFEDERGEMFFHLAKVIKAKKPQIIFIENVKNLFTHDKGNTYKVIEETLTSYGYKLKTMILNGAEYGNVPQNRERIYIIGFLNQEVYDRFETISPTPLTKKISDIVNYNEKVEEKYYYTKEKCKFYDELEKTIVQPNTIYQWRRTYVRENKSQLCPTLTANMGTGGHNVPLVLTKHGIRKLTPRECFLFQGYPEDFVLPKDMAPSHLYKQAGNSVVVPVIERLAQAIKKSLEETKASN